MSKKKNIDYINLLDSQIINHFVENKSITAKFGLTRNIRNIVSQGKNHYQLYPRCYDVNDVAELEDFYQDFKFTYVKSILKQIVRKQGVIQSKQEQKCYEIVAEVLKKQLIPFEQKVKCILQNTNKFYITVEQWKQLTKLNKKQTQNKVMKINEDLYQTLIKLNNFFIENDKQYNLNLNNIWIVKPASMSRGRGIRTFDNLYAILDYIVGKQISWVVQKYIQKPLIIKSKKFDIRLWVLLTDFKPMRIWVYNECYVRFTADIYKIDDLNNRASHLTNNSVTKGVNKKQDGIEGNMMTQEQFAALLEQIKGKQVFSSIRKQMHKIAVQTLYSVKQNILSRKNTFQLFGYDFMVDQTMKVWLIQVNSSPTMEHSTKVTEKIVKKGMNDLADLVQNYMTKGKIYDHSKKHQLYGNWNLLTNH